MLLRNLRRFFSKTKTIQSSLGKGLVLLTLILLTIAFGVLVTVACQLSSEELVTVVVSDTAEPPVRFAAKQLCHYLGLIYPKSRFEIGKPPTEHGPVILLGTFASMPGLEEHTEAAGVGRDEESFVVTVRNKDSKNEGLIAGASPRAVLYAVYELLERLGCGFYLSSDTLPQPREAAFSFEAWQLSDAPVIRERIVFNWHNFLSGCSAWDLPDWQHWILQASKMKFNTVMVHAYGNNPIFSFSHNGLTKPVGFLTTTNKGRDWSTEHVNDVRRVFGGNLIFEGPVFGSAAARVDEDKRVEAAGRLMTQVFTLAKDSGMRVCFALDIDTKSSNPQNILMTLPRKARVAVEFDGKKFYLANPDTPEGYDYYKSQIEALLNRYPQIDQLAAWFRWPNQSPLRALEEKDFPDNWKSDYRTIIKEDSPLETKAESASLYAVSRVVEAFRRALDEFGREDVVLAIGTWGLNRPWFEAAHPFFSRDVKFIALDYHVSFDTEMVQQHIKAVSGKREIVPVVWAHHDDRTYLGRPYQPFSEFASKLEKNGSSGYGIIHWTTRPLDLYFKSLAKQVWLSSSNEPLKKTVEEIAERSFGTQFRDLMGRYLYQWVKTAPQFGRETGERFVDRPLDHPDAAINGCRERLKLLAELDESLLNRNSVVRFEYFKLMEQFFLDFYSAQTALDRSQRFFQKGEISKAREEMIDVSPEEVLSLYAQMSSLGGISSGEKGLLVSMNLRWLPDFIALRQCLGLEALRFNFSPTQHEMLAQQRGRKTYYFDREQNVWECLGDVETGAKAYALDPRKRNPGSLYGEICTSGIETAEPLSLTLRPSAHGDLAPGRYEVSTLFMEPEMMAEGERVFDLVLRGKKENSGERERLSERVDIFEKIGGREEVLCLVHSLEISQGFLELELHPRRGKALISGVVIVPAENWPSVPSRVSRKLQTSNSLPGTSGSTAAAIALKSATITE